MKAHIVVEAITDKDPDFVSVNSLKLMIASENNQTQIVGAQLSAALVKSLFIDNRISENLPLSRVEGQFWHLTKLS